jgi:hypothetical protein
MDTLSLTKSILKFKSVVKDQLFYDRYEYCFGFYLPEANTLRGIKQHDQIDERLKQRTEWRELATKRWHAGIPTRWNPITDQVRQDLHEVGDLVLDSDCKLVVTSDNGWIYTNDLTLIDQLRSMKCLKSKTYARAVINRAKNTILLKNSQYTSRSYFNTTKLTFQEKETLKNFFLNQREHIRLSPSFNEWITIKPFQRLMDHYFIDYTGEQWLTMLSLIRPGLIRKTQQIVTK